MWGHGHDQQPGETPPEFISRDESDLLLRKDLANRFEPRVTSVIPTGTTPTQNQFDALVDFDYNEGNTAIATLLSHGWDQVTNQLPHWCFEHVNGVLVKSDGLFERRQKEVALFNA